jgi:hypothetical protein
MQQGIAIDTLNNQKQNCLDVAIERGHTEVIKVLLTDPNWHKLMTNTISSTNDNDDDVHEDEIDKASDVQDDDDVDSDESDDVNKSKVNTMVYLRDRKSVNPLNIAMKSLQKRKASSKASTKKRAQKKSMAHTVKLKEVIKIRENPQFYAMYQKEMWDMLRIVLENCKQSNGLSYDFKQIDAPFHNIQAHPLMLLAKSGQEFLLKHPTVEKLLALKWRFLPRFVFYANITLFLLFVILYSIYVVKLSNVAIIAPTALLENNESIIINETDKPWV